MKAVVPVILQKKIPTQFYHVNLEHCLRYSTASQEERYLFQNRLITKKKKNNR